MKKTLIICLLLAGVTGCTSQPTSVRYYTLQPTVALNESPFNVERTKTLLIERIRIADFLSQPGLVIQQGNHQLHISKKHLWAEKLTDGLAKNLTSQLEHASPDYRVVMASDRWLESADYTLQLRIDSFHSNDQGEVIARGQYFLDSVGSPSEIHSFTLSRELNQDGHGAAVTQLEQLLKELAKHILHSIEQAPKPTIQAKPKEE